MRKRTYLSIILVFALFVAALPFHVSAQDPVTITWWHINTDETGLNNWQAVADAYTAENPHVTIEITVLANEDFKTRLTSVMQAGDPPDLFQSWGGGVLRAYADAGLVRDISSELEGEWRDSFSAQAALDLYGQDGEFYGTPWTWGAVGFFYNKSLFEEAGLDPEAPPATWSEFLDAVQTLKDAGITPLAVGEREKWPGHFYWVYLATRIGGQEAFDLAYSREGSFADEPFVAAGEALQELVALEPFQEGFLGLGYGDQVSAMANELVAMELMGQWSQSLYAGASESGEDLGDKLGWFAFPMVEGGAGNPDDVMGGGDGFAVGANAEDEAVDFLRYITSAEVQTAMTEVGLVLPVVAAAEETISDPVQLQIVAVRNGAPYFQLYYDQFLPPAVGGAVNDAVETLFAGAASAEEAAEAIEESASFEMD